MADTHRRIGELQEAVDRLHGDLGRVHQDMNRDLDRVLAMVRHVYDEEPANRRRLYELRESEEYGLAFTEPEPLVSFVVTTYTSYATLRDVALPSILNQTYSNLDVVVVGDAAPPETGRVIAELDDPRIRYYNRTIRGPYPEDRSRWFVIGTPPFNEAVSRARGRWIAAMADDDAARPHHVETLLKAAQENRYEHCYGRQLVRFAEGDKMELGTFPPRLGQWGLQAALYHSGLRFFELELPDAFYDEPSDWSLCRRMLRAGVRTGMVDQVVVDKHETRRRTAADWNTGRVPEVD